MVTEFKQSITECTNCHTMLTFTDNDVKVVNQGAWEECYIKCPKCGNRIEVCHMNGKWKSKINNIWQ